MEGESYKRMIRFTSGHFMYKVEGGSHYHSLGVFETSREVDFSSGKEFSRHYQISKWAQDPQLVVNTDKIL